MAYQLGSKRPDGSPRFCKLHFESILAHDELLAKARNLKGQSALTSVQIRPALRPTQHQRKQILDDFRWGSFKKDSSGRFPIAVHYEHSGDPYLWHFGHKEHVEPPSSVRPRTTSVESSSSVPDHEIVRGDLLVSPVDNKDGLALDVSLLPPSPASGISTFDSAEVVLKSPSSPIVPVLEPESSTKSAQLAAKVSIVIEDTQVPAAEFVPPMHHKTEHELFLDCMQKALECLQKPFPDENQALHDEHEDLVSRAMQAWIKFDDLTLLEKMGSTKRVQAWVAFFNI